MPKPILKWIGGKTQIIDKLMTDFPRDINNYREIFLGGGSVLFALLSNIQKGTIQLHGNIYAYDLNEPLIYVYKNIQSHPMDLYEQLQPILQDYHSCNNETEKNRKPITLEEAKTTKESYYYWIRTKYNTLSPNDKKTTLGSAMFLFLNKTCFRGIFRVGPNGFNVPYGHYKNPEIINKDHLEEIHHLIQPVIFECSHFNISLLLSLCEPNDFIYLDPPYAPQTDTISFVGYTEYGFNIETHHSLFKQIHQITESDKNIKIMLNNADVDLVRVQFTQKKYNIQSLLCKRTIHSKNPNAKAKEVIIKNYY